MDLSSHLYIYISKIFITLGIALVAIAYKKQVQNKLEDLKNKDLEEVPNILSPTEIKTKSLSFAVGGFFILLFLGIPFFICLVVAALILFSLPKYLQLNAREKMYKDFDDTLADSLQGMASSIEAGLTLQQSLSVAVESSAPAFAYQAKRAVLEYKLGTDIDTCLLNISKRIPTGSAKMSIGALVIGRKLGGPLPTILRRIANIIRERSRVEGRLRALTAQGRGQGFLVCSLPIAVIIGTALFAPAKFEMLTSTLMGQALLFTVLGLEGIGIYATLKTLKMEI